MTTRGRVLVTGADQHQGLAVIRGLGRAGVPVIAAGSEPDCLGFASRHTTEARVYASPFRDPDRCMADLVAMIKETRPAVVIPGVESTLVLLNAVRAEVERHTILAAPSSEILEIAIDKARTIALARTCGVPAPRTAQGETLDALLMTASRLRFPVAVKPRGNALHSSTAHSVGFKSRYAATPSALRAMLTPFAADASALLVQEYAHGVGRCVSAVCDQGVPLALFAYERDREVPLSGGVSVVRRSIRLDPALEGYTIALLAELRWHGVAMVEFKYDPDTRQYMLMEINGRFQASTALSLDAGLNLPHLVASLHAGWPLPEVEPYRVGVRERWLRGDALALVGAWRGTPAEERPVPVPFGRRLVATWHFVREFHPRMNYDEFKWDDWRPGVVEARNLVRLGAGWAVDRLAGARRRLVAATRALILRFRRPALSTPPAAAPQVEVAPSPWNEAAPRGQQRAGLAATMEQHRG